MLKYKVSYKSEWSEDGTHYDQTITIFIPCENVLKHLINASINAYREMSGSWMVHTYLKPLNMGKNHTNLTTAEYIVVNFLNPDDTRIKRNRNTIINVKIEK